MISHTHCTTNGNLAAFVPAIQRRTPLCNFSMVLPSNTSTSHRSRRRRNCEPSACLTITMIVVTSYVTIMALIFMAAQYETQVEMEAMMIDLLE